MNRRTFIKSLGSGLLVAAAAPVLAEVEPVRRFWQVGRNAPVGRPNTWDMLSDRLIVYGSDGIPHEYDRKDVPRELWPEHGYTFTPSSPLTFEMHGTVGPGETSAAWTRIRGGSSRYDRATAKHAERVAIAEEMHNRGMLTDEQTIKALDQAGADWDRESGVKYPREGTAYDPAWDLRRDEQAFSTFDRVAHRRRYSFPVKLELPEPYASMVREIVDPEALT